MPPQAHVCVQQTCLALLDRGVNVVVVADGTSSQRVGDRVMAMQWMQGAGAAITTTESLVMMLCRTADNPAFKSVLGTLVAHNKRRNRLLEEGIEAGAAAVASAGVRLA